MASDRGQTVLFFVAISLVVICAAAAVWVASVSGPAGEGTDNVHRTATFAAPGDDLVIDFTGRSGRTAVPWRVEGKTDSVRRTARGLLIISSTADDPPRLVLDLGAPEESFGLLEVTMALNKGVNGRVWGSRYAGEPPSDGRSRFFPLKPGIGARTYRVDLGSGESRGAPLHSLSIQLTDAPVRAVVRQVRLLRTAGWHSYMACGSGEESMVVIGGIGVSAVPAPENGSLTVEAELPADRPRLHLALAIHPLQRILGRPEIEFRARVEPLDNEDRSPGDAAPLFQRMLHPGDPDQGGWIFDEADLSAWAGRRVRLHLETLTWRREGGSPERLLPGRPPWALPLWGPVMISSGDGNTAPPPAGIVLVLLDGVGQDELGCYGDPSSFPAVSRHFGGAAHLCDAYLVEFGQEHFLQTLFHADYLTPEFNPDSFVSDESLVSHLHGRGFRTAAFYGGGGAEKLLRNRRLQAGFELIGRSDFELGLPPSIGDEWSESNPLLDLPGPLSWLGQLGNEPFFLLVHLDAGGSKAVARTERLAAIDRAVGRLAARLGTAGLLENTVICLGGLRGPVREARVDRGCRLWDESALTPMLIRVPGGLPGVPDRDLIFRSIDILPTLCDLAGLDLKAGGTAGLSLAPWIRGNASGAWPVEEVFIAQRRIGRRYLGLRRGPIKLIWRTKPRALAACYDLDADPGERNDISPAGPFNRPLHDGEPLGSERFAELVRRLESHFGP